MSNEHEPLPLEGDYFALESACTACDRRTLWRIGTGAWDHAQD